MILSSQIDLTWIKVKLIELESIQIEFKLTSIQVKKKSKKKKVRSKVASSTCQQLDAVD